MKRFKTLLLREWLQHRFAWAMMVLIPLALGVVLTSLGQIELDDVARDRPHELALIAGLGSLAASTIILTAIAACASIITVVGLARRDHGDRSVEFWLSMPISHASSFAAPLLVHLVLVPIAAMAAGFAAGLVISMVVVTRVDSFGSWWSLPWGSVFIGSMGVIARFAAGLPLALLWLSPLILLTVLLCAWFKRWGLLVLAAIFMLAGMDFAQAFGRPIVVDALLEMLRQAGQAFVYPDDSGMKDAQPEGLVAMLRAAPSWAVSNFGQSVRELASPLLPLGLAFAALCFVGLVDWRRRGAMAAG